MSDEINERLASVSHRIFLWSLGIIGAGIIPLFGAALRGYVNQQVLLENQIVQRSEIEALKAQLARLQEESYEARVDFYRFYYEQTGGKPVPSHDKFESKPTK